jgi:hypothetical protein
VSDGIRIMKAGTGVVALITTPFCQQAELVAMSKDMPDLPCIELPYPVAGTGDDNLLAVARDIAPNVLTILDRWIAR